MKTCHEIKYQIGELKKAASIITANTQRGSADEKEIKNAEKERGKIAKRIAFLHSCFVYLESSPREEYLRREVARLSKIVRGIEKRAGDAYDEWLRNNYMGKLARKQFVNKYKKEHGCAVMESEISTMKFLLSDA